MVCGSAPLRGALPQTQKSTNDLVLLYLIINSPFLKKFNSTIPTLDKLISEEIVF